MDLEAIRVARPRTLQDGAAPARERAQQIDDALAGLAREAYLVEIVAVVAVGGYGRGELSPLSDVDLLFLASSTRSEPALRDFLYPLWDAGFQVGHAIRTPKDAIAFAQKDVHAATSLLSIRSVAGRRDLSEELIERRDAWVQRDRRALVRAIAGAVDERHRMGDRAGWMLAPDIKEDIGGLRDAHATSWLAAVTGDEVPPELTEACEVLVAVREALHAGATRRSDRLRMDLQPQVAAALGLQGDQRHDDLMEHVHTAARTIETHAAFARTETIRRTQGPRRTGWSERLGRGVRAEDGELLVEDDLGDLDRALALLEAHARSARPIASPALTSLSRAFSAEREPAWTPAMLDSFVSLLAAPHARSALEIGDQVGAWVPLIPGWRRIRALAQHDPYHRYTVDGHLFATVEQVSAVVEDDPTARVALDEAGDPAALYLAALLHDVGKGGTGDHSEAGERIAREMCRHMGVADGTTQEVAVLVRHHLLLSDTATRRDLSDGEVISSIAATVGTPRLLRLLYVLSIADAKATGTHAWTSWKATLLYELYTKTLVALETGKLPARSDVRSKASEVETYEPALAGRAAEILETLPAAYLTSATVPDMVDEIRLLMERPGPGQVRYNVLEGLEPTQQVLTVCTPDRPGTLARTAGVLALNRVDVLHAEAYTTSDGFALERFVVQAAGEPDWSAIGRDLEAVYTGRLALDARLDRKVAEYEGDTAADVDVRVIDEASSDATVVEVRAGDRLGLLYALTSALTALDLDIQLAKIDTLGHRVVDVFYLRTAWGAKLDPRQIGELRSALRHSVHRLGRDSGR